MDLKEYRRKLIGSDEERAVSPVIGVVLMIAITVILAAVITAFVLDMTPGSQTLSASADVETNSTGGIYVELTGGGEDIDGVAFVDGSGTVENSSTYLSNTGASHTYENGTSGPLDDTTTYTVYAYQGDVGEGGDSSIDDADASVKLGEATTG